MANLPKGRPSIYSKELADKICEELSKSGNLNKVCRDNPDFPAESTIRNWAANDLDGFFAKYARARDIGLDVMADSLLDISDDGTNDYVAKQAENGVSVLVDHDHISRSRLRVDTRKWYLSKLAPKKYGEKLELGGSVNISKLDLSKLTDSELATLEALQEKAHAGQ